MKHLMFRVTVVVIGVVLILGTFTATTSVAQYCSPRAQGSQTNCFCTNYLCTGYYECQGMDCQVGTNKATLGLQCVLAVCSIFTSSCMTVG
jgi:hypothetical protein